VTPEEGRELTRIEQRINRLLMRDELQGFEAEFTDSKRDANEPEPPPPPAAAMKRPRRRHRRAL